MKTAITGIILYVAFVGAILFGEIRCIYQFCTSDFEPSYKREIIYGVAAVTGLGAIVGYIDIADTPQK